MYMRLFNFYNTLTVTVYVFAVYLIPVLYISGIPCSLKSCSPRTRASMVGEVPSDFLSNHKQILR